MDISTSTLPRYETRVKMRWDDAFLYVGAQLRDAAVWANISHTCHCLDPVNDQVRSAEGAAAERCALDSHDE